MKTESQYETIYNGFKRFNLNLFILKLHNNIGIYPSIES